MLIEQGEKSGLKIAGIVALLVLGLWAAVSCAIILFIPKWEQRGQFGDTFGAVNALFSGLAFAGLIYAILLQRAELSLQRKELQLQRIEMQGSRQALAEQALLQRLQLKANLSELRIRVKQAEVALIETETRRVPEYAWGPLVEKLRHTVDKMDQIVTALQDHISDIESTNIPGPATEGPLC